MIANIDEIKASMTMEELLTVLGYEIGRRGRSKCPVHGGNDKNFSAKDQHGTCFSQCGGKTWSVTDLVMEVKGLEFPEAIEWIASQSNVQVKYTSGDRQEVVEAAKKERELKAVLYDVNESVLQLYQGETEITLTQKYDFDGRTWSGETVKAFGLVQSPNDNVLVKTKHGINREHLTELGLIKHSEKNDAWYDFLRGRILFPIYTHQGRVAGFSGRKLSNAHKDSAKYKNSQESLVYRKRDMLYGLWQNRRTIQQDGAILFEGMADVVTAYDYGVRNTVASGGTAITSGQMRLLKRFTNKLTILLDGDEAGYKAAKTAVDEAIVAGFRTQVYFFDEPDEEAQAQGIKRYDPDNFLRKHNKRGFEMALEAGAQDGLVWRVMEEWDDNDIYDQRKAVGLAARLISMLEDDMVKDYYKRALLDKSNFGKVNKNALEDAIDSETKKRLVDANKPDLSAQQQGDIKKYGVYIRNNQYWVSGNDESEGYPVSNFCVRPVMLVVGSAKSERRVEISNIYKAKFTTNIDSDSFVELSAFRKAIERRGNFLFLETFHPNDFVKIKRKLYDEMKVCYPITTLGRHAKKDFYAFCNGIVVGDAFHEATPNGIVNYQDAKFFLPGMANNDDEMLSDDEDNSYEAEQHFIYVNEVKAPSFTEWSTKMVDIHGDKGMMGVAWYLAALFRDLIYGRNDCFPHLNGFGPPGCGKSFLAWSISYMFGKARRPYNLTDGTNVGFFRRMAQVRNGVAWFDEYSNDIDFKRAQGLKNAYDGAGREKGVASTDNRTVTTKVNSGLIITGQQMMVQDIAMYTRCITLSFPQIDRTPEQLTKGDELMALQKTGCLSQITAHLQQYRNAIDEDFDQVYHDVRGQLKGMVEGKDVLDRLVNNYAVALAAAYVIDQREKLGFEFGALLEFSLQNLLWQSQSIGEEDDLAVWWNVVHYYIAKYELRHNEDIIVQELRSLKVRDPQGKERDTMDVSFEQDQKVLFLTLTKAFPFYKEQTRKEGRKNSLNKEAIKYYLQGSPAYIGEVRAKKFNGSAKRCMVFDLDRLNFDLELSKHVTYEEDDDT